MNATLYLPHQLSQAVSVEGLCMPDAETGFARVPPQVPPLLGCVPGLVDVLACGQGYVAYSVFDSEGEVNWEAMIAVAAVSGVVFDSKDEDSVLRGPVLLAIE
jgi:hypothetical protein